MQSKRQRRIRRKRNRETEQRKIEKEVEALKRQSFTDGWRYQKKGGMEWKEIVLPHDAMIHERREPEGEGGSAHGYRR